MAEFKMHNSPDRLVVDYTPWATGVILIIVTLLFIAFGMNGFVGDQVSPLWWYGSAACSLLAAAVFVHRVRLVLDASDRTLAYHYRSVFGSEHVTAPLAEIGPLHLSKSYTTGGGSTGEGGKSRVTLHQIQISLPDQTLQLPKSHIGSPSVPQAHDALTAWLARVRDG